MERSDRDGQQKERKSSARAHPGFLHLANIPSPGSGREPPQNLLPKIENGGLSDLFLLNGRAIWGE
jgi:hypothetical protein